MKTCKDCKWYKGCMEIGELSPENCFVFEQRTNFDKVTVSPEVLASYMDDIRAYGVCHVVDGHWNENCKLCEECITRWLKQEAEDDVADNDE